MLPLLLNLHQTESSQGNSAASELSLQGCRNQHQYVRLRYTLAKEHLISRLTVWAFATTCLSFLHCGFTADGTEVRHENPRGHLASRPSSHCYLCRSRNCRCSWFACSCRWFPSSCRWFACS